MSNRAANCEELSEQTVCYLCSILDEGIILDRGIISNNPAATKKVIDISRVLKALVRNVYIVSAGRGRQKDEKICEACVRKVDGIPVIYALYYPLIYVSHAATSISMLILMSRLRRSSSDGDICVIAYNRQWIYVPALVLCRIVGIKCYLDLEDDALLRKSNILSRSVYRIKRRLFNYLCNRGSLVASSCLLSHVNTSNNVVCHGVGVVNQAACADSWKSKPIKLHLGGTLIHETGANLLASTIKIMNRNYSEYKGRLVIEVTGYGNASNELKSLSAGEGMGWMVFHGAVNRDEYERILRSCHIGLCLKLPSEEMAAVTFPSKTIEIASYGKLLLTTKLCDVENIFHETGACYLENESPEELARVILRIIANPEHSLRVAYMGQKHMLKECSESHVAADLSTLLCGL